MSSTERLAPPHAPAVAFVAAAASLRGRRYGEDRLHLLVRDPFFVMALWEIAPATADAAASRAQAANAPARYRLRVERARDGEPESAAVVIAEADLPDALGGESWYLAIPPAAGRARALLGLDLHGRFESILVSRWVATPPAGPCDRVAPWPLGEGGEAWAAAQARLAGKGVGLSLPSSAARYLPATPPVLDEAKKA